MSTSGMIAVAVAGSLLVGAASAGGGVGGPNRRTLTMAAGAGQASAPAVSSVGDVGDLRAVASPVTVVKADPAAAARVPVGASSARERRVVRRILAALGARRAVRAVALASAGAGGKVATITIAPVGGPRGEFEAMVVGDAVSRQLPRYTRLQISGPGGVSGPIAPTDTPPSVSAPALGASVAAGLSAAGLSVRSVRVFGLPVPAVEIVIRLREDELFDNPAPDWLAAVDSGPAGRPFASLTIVETPKGGVISVAGHVGGGGFAIYGPSAKAPIPASAPAILYQRPTHLTITVRRPAFTRLPETDIIWTLDCQNRDASTFAHPRRACDRVIRDRWALFAPQPQTACGGGSPWADTITITGQLASHPVSYTAGGCSTSSLTRWERLLGVGPRGAT